MPAVLWAVLIFLLCSIPGKDIPGAGWMEVISLDKWVHFGIFAILMIFILHAIRRQYSAESWRFDGRWVWLIAVVIYGGLTELYQHWMLADRTADVYDFIANTAGAIIGWSIYERYYSSQKRNHSYEKTF